MYTWIALILAIVILYINLDRKKIGMKLRIRKYARAGVSFLDPSRVYIEKGVQIGRGTTIHPNVHLYSGTYIGQNCNIHSDANIFESTIGEGVTIWPNVSMYKAKINALSTIHSHCRIVRSVLHMHVQVDSHSLVKDSELGFRSKAGPYAYIRDNSILEDYSEVANIEIVRSRVGSGTKAKHGRYIGDAEIGKNCNIGAGTVLCNYDGSQKHKTILEDDVFVGSGSMLIAPLTLGKESFIAAGSVVSRDVEANNLVIERGQVHKHHPGSGKGEGKTIRPGHVTKDEDGWHLGGRI